MFKKIEIEFNEDDFKKRDQIITQFGVDEDGEFKGIRYNECDVSQEFISKVLTKIPVSMIQHFKPSIMSINREIPPHIDSDISTVINLYLKAGGYTTDFNRPKEGAESFQIENQTNGYIIDFSQVDVVDSFTAEDGDAYILDVTQLHSVHGGEGDRVAVAIQTKLPFDKVCEVIG